MENNSSTERFILNFQFSILNFPGPALIQASSALLRPRTIRPLSVLRAYYSQIWPCTALKYTIILGMPQSWGLGRV